MRNRKCTKRTRTLGVHTSLGNHLAVKVCQLFDQPYVLKQRRAAFSGSCYILIVVDGSAGFSRELCHIILSFRFFFYADIEVVSPTRFPTG
jgi:hypothetical protein